MLENHRDGWPVRTSVNEMDFCRGLHIHAVLLIIICELDSTPDQSAMSMRWAWSDDMMAGDGQSSPTATTPS